MVHGVKLVHRQFAMVQQAASMMRARQVGRLFSRRTAAICRTGWCTLKVTITGRWSRRWAALRGQWRISAPTGATRCSL